MIPTINYEDYEGPSYISDIMKKYRFIFEANPDYFKALQDIEIPLLDV